MIKNTITQFIDDCNNCGKCVKTCPFLQRYGKPAEILQRDDETVFECTNCNACTLVCPTKLSPSDALFAKKTEIINTGRYSSKIQSVLDIVRAFVNRGHKFPFKHYSNCEVVFWPGCGLAGVSPQIVKTVTKCLSKSLNKPVGIVLDCCFDPCYQMGDVKTVDTTLKDINETLNQNGIKTVITGCANCTKVLGMFLKDIVVVHFLEVLQPEDFDGLKSDVFTIHHPCPSFRFEKPQTVLKEMFKDSESNELPQCCGFGGELHHINLDLSLRFADIAINKTSGADKKILTYCMGCKQRFIKQGTRAYHILEHLKDAEKVDQPPSTFGKYLNRFILATTERINLKKLAVFFILIALILAVLHLRSQGYISVEGFMDFIKGYPVLAPLLFIMLYAIGPSLFLPSLAMTLGAGFIWGPLWGSVFSITGATIGATVPFLLSRYIIGDWILQRFSKERQETLKEKVRRHGWKAVAFARLVPIFPFPVLNYLFGLTPISIFHYVWATFVFMLPACIAYTAFGSSMGELILKGNITGLIIGIVIASVALLIPFALKKFVKKVQDDK